MWTRMQLAMVNDCFRGTIVPSGALGTFTQQLNRSNMPRPQPAKAWREFSSGEPKNKGKATKTRQGHVARGEGKGKGGVTQLW